MEQSAFGYQATRIQRAFAEKGVELLYKNTLDTYRLRLHNPKTIISELVSITGQVKAGILTRHGYVAEVANEAHALLDGENDSLQFVSVNKAYYLDLLKKANNPTEFGRLIQASRLILRENKDYLARLITKIEVKLAIDDGELTDKDIDDLLYLCHYHIIELVNQGYTKQYLYQFFRTIFVHASSFPQYNDRFIVWKNLSNGTTREYKVIYKIAGNEFLFDELLKIDSDYINANKIFRASLPPTTSDRFISFLEKNKKNKLIALTTTTLDHFKAVEISRAKLANDLDLYHLGFHGIRNSIEPQAGVISSEDPTKASTVPSNYQIDGFIRSDRDVFESLLAKVVRLKDNKVSEESIDKLTSGFRYLRIGSEATELETKLLNYWIGLEYICTSHTDPESTIVRIQQYFPSCHALIYPKRNLYDFHKSIERDKISHLIPDYGTDLIYLSKHQTYTHISQHTTNPLIKHRAIYFQKWVSSPSNIKSALFFHRSNLKWNLSRIYRIRNEIVHNAAVKTNIYTNVAHIKYYLTFILNSILDFFSAGVTDMDNDGSITIDDYFIAQDIMLGALDGKTITDYLNVNSSLELLH